MKTQYLKLAFLGLFMVSFTFMSFAEGNKKSKKANLNAKACLERVVNEVINENIDTFSFNKDLEIASQQFEELYVETSLKQNINADLEFAEKLFFDVQSKNETQISFIQDLMIADQLFQSIEIKESL